METFDFPQALLDRASKITLADLLDSPLTQCWAVSMAANAIQTSQLRSNTAELTEADEIFEFRINKIVNAIPFSERNELFHQCGALISKRREVQTQQPEIK